MNLPAVRIAASRRPFVAVSVIGAVVVPVSVVALRAVGVMKADAPMGLGSLAALGAGTYFLGAMVYRNLRTAPTA